MYTLASFNKKELSNDEKDQVGWLIVNGKMDLTTWTEQNFANPQAFFAE